MSTKTDEGKNTDQPKIKNIRQHRLNKEIIEGDIPLSQSDIHVGLHNNNDESTAPNSRERIYIIDEVPKYDGLIKQHRESKLIEFSRPGASTNSTNHRKVESLSSSDYESKYVYDGKSHGIRNIGHGTKSYENPAFEGGASSSYDTFAENDSEDLEMPYLADNISIVEVADDDNFEHDLMHSLPSTQLRKIRGIATAGSIRRRDIDITDNPIDGNNDINIDDVAIQGLDSKHIRSMVTTLDRKKSVMMQVHENERRAKHISGWKNFKYSCAMNWIKFRIFLKESFASLHIWKSHMKKVEGLFGTGVLSYFTFLRWLLYINLLVSVLTMSFLFAPQIIFERSSVNNTETFTGLELLTGEGWFTQSELYYGHYTNEKVNDKYAMKFAYLFVGGGYLLICIMILASSMANSYKRNFINSDDAISPFAIKVFCSWDYGISNRETADMKKKSIAQDMIETLWSNKVNLTDLKCGQYCCIFLLRMFTNIIALGLMAGSAFLIYYISENSINDTIGTSNDLKGLLPALTISAANLIMPSAFRLLATVEKYQYVGTELTVTLIRTVILKLASLVVYVITLHTQLTATEKVGNQDKLKIEGICWETFIGQSFYKLVIIDFLSVLVSTFFGQFIKDLFAKYVGCCRKHRPVFDVSKDVLNLIYAQGICWLGTFYCPLLPIINVFKLITTFYIKRISVVQNCRPSMRPFKASKMNVLFLALLSLMLILALIVIGFVIMEDGTLRPSRICGPFRDEPSIYSVVWLVIKELPNSVQKFIDVVSSLSLIAAAIFLIGLLAYYFRMRKQSTEKKIKLLKHQLSLAGQDKQYLIKKLRMLLTTENSHAD